MKLTKIEKQIVNALSHPEAEEGLYLENLSRLHHEEDRPGVFGSQVEILDALKALIHAGLVHTDESGEKVIFSLTQN